MNWKSRPTRIEHLFWGIVGNSAILENIPQTRLPGLIEMNVKQILQKELKPLEERLKGLVGDIARKCLSDLLKDWQTSELGAAGPLRRTQSPCDSAEV